MDVLVLNAICLISGYAFCQLKLQPQQQPQILRSKPLSNVCCYTFISPFQINIASEVSMTHPINVPIIKIMHRTS
jgi:hypothetical protein